MVSRAVIDACFHCSPANIKPSVPSVELLLPGARGIALVGVGVAYAAAAL
jgi:hypothetical protein